MTKLILFGNSTDLNNTSTLSDFINLDIAKLMRFIHFSPMKTRFTRYINSSHSVKSEQILLPGDYRIHMKQDMEIRFMFAINKVNIAHLFDSKEQLQEICNYTALMIAVKLYE